jgi:ABC-type antimicrobial peptide transport system permease subunit
MTDVLIADVHSRTAELGTLRAVGARRRHLRAMVLAEAGMLAGFGMLLAAALGIGLAWLWTTTTFRMLTSPCGARRGCSRPSRSGWSEESWRTARSRWVSSWIASPSATAAWTRRRSTT